MLVAVLALQYCDADEKTPAHRDPFSAAHDLKSLPGLIQRKESGCAGTYASDGVGRVSEWVSCFRPRRPDLIRERRMGRRVAFPGPMGFPPPSGPVMRSPAPALGFLFLRSHCRSAQF
jgi:hypothetical protein